MVAHKEERDPKSREGLDHKKRSGLFVGALDEFHNIEDDSPDLRNRRTKSQYFSSKGHTASQRISFLDFAKQLVSEVRLQLIEL